jgi:FkbM family methyltransferase
MIRRYVELATRRLVFRRQLPERYGGRSFYASTEGGLKYLLPGSRIDPNLTESAKRIVRPGDVVWDVGANLGLFAFAAAGLAGPQGSVYALEADADLARLLARSAALKHGSAPVYVRQDAVWDAVTTVKFQIAKRSKACNHIEGHGHAQAGGVREVRHVRAITLDRLACETPEPQVIKIDVEGAELRVLSGACTVLAKHRPKILIEVSQENAVEVSRLLHGYGYVLHDADKPGRPRVDLATWNTLAIAA